jgi:hypothetical protein
MIANIVSGCELVGVLDFSYDQQYFNCARRWEDECGCLPPPTGYSASDAYSTLCPANKCYTDGVDGVTQWSNLKKEKITGLELKRETGWGEAAPQEKTAVMVQLASSTRKDDSTLIRVAGGMTCLAVGAVLLVAHAAGRRRRSGYTALPAVNQASDTICAPGGRKLKYFDASGDANFRSAAQDHMV